MHSGLQWEGKKNKNVSSLGSVCENCNQEEEEDQMCVYGWERDRKKE